MSRVAAPQVCCLDGIFVVKLGPDYSHLYEAMIDDLAVLKLLAQSAEPPRVVLDLANVELIGSALIGFLVSISQELKRRNGTFALANANEFCQTAIELTKLGATLPVFESPQAAVHQLSSNSRQPSQANEQV